MFGIHRESGEKERCFPFTGARERDREMFGIHRESGEKERCFRGEKERDSQSEERDRERTN